MPQVHSQQTRHVDPMLGQCWVDVVDGGPTLGRCVVFAGFFVYLSDVV